MIDDQWDRRTSALQISICVFRNMDCLWLLIFRTNYELFIKLDYLEFALVVVFFPIWVMTSRVFCTDLFTLNFMFLRWSLNFTSPFSLVVESIFMIIFLSICVELPECNFWCCWKSSGFLVVWVMSWPIRGSWSGWEVSVLDSLLFNSLGKWVNMKRLNAYVRNAWPGPCPALCQYAT